MDVSGEWIPSLVHLTVKSAENPIKSSDFLIDLKNLIWYNSKLRRCACQGGKEEITALSTRIQEEGAAA